MKTSSFSTAPDTHTHTHTLYISHEKNKFNKKNTLYFIKDLWIHRIKKNRTNEKSLDIQENQIFLRRKKKTG